MSSATTTTTEVVTEHAVPEAAGLGALGINAFSLLFQVVNFLLLLLILRWAVYKPLLKVLQQRRQLAEEALANAATAREAREQTEVLQAQARQAAEQQAQKIVARGHEQAQAIVSAAREAAAQDVERMQRDGQAALAAEATRAASTLMQHVRHFVAQATELVLKKKLDSAADTRLIEEAIAATQPEKHL